MPTSEQAKLIMKRLNHLVAVTVVLFVLLLGTIGYSVKSNYDLAKKGDQAKTAVCTLRDDLQKRISASESYLATHPGDVLGIPREQVMQSLENQKSTLKALETAGCN